ncbi:MAG TPA: BrnT family toxin [Marinobacter sp.]|uniref:Phage-Barnase-EndoU-ColicinE5/D-RelE like nuclease 3 domain-containing protein n=1 Tax=marine sediment metagenome TaxID=412755 RepID=A0A0F9WR50_9ZZZZ|nr:BrnT family toxin [Marinobacter sp.]
MKEITDKLGIPEWEFRVVIGRTKIDFDINKEQANRKKHGYSLESAVDQLEKLLLPLGNPRPFMTSDGCQEKGEVRHMHVGVDDSGHVVLIVTTMRPNETVRVISYRRANQKEKDDLFHHTGYREP